MTRKQLSAAMLAILIALGLLAWVANQLLGGVL